MTIIIIAKYIFLVYDRRREFIEVVLSVYGSVNRYLRLIGSANLCDAMSASNLFHCFMYPETNTRTKIIIAVKSVKIVGVFGTVYHSAPRPT